MRVCVGFWRFCKVHIALTYGKVGIGEYTMRVCIYLFILTIFLGLRRLGGGALRVRFVLLRLVVLRVVRIGFLWGCKPNRI